MATVGLMERSRGAQRPKVMNKTWASALCFVVALGMAGCDSDASKPQQDTQPRPSASRDSFPVGSTANYELLTHCGVRYAVIDGRNWETEWRFGGVTEQRSKYGIAPKGWGNFVTGRLTRPDSDRIEFATTGPESPLVIEFHPSRSPFPGCD